MSEFSDILGAKHGFDICALLAAPKYFMIWGAAIYYELGRSNLL